MLSQLQNKIRGKSFNFLRRVYPEQIQAWLGATDVETQKFLSDLLEERLVR